MKASLSQSVRTACAQVAAAATHVHIVHECIAPYATSLPLQPLEQPCHDPDTHYLGRGPDTVAFFITLDAINFGSGYFPHLRKRPGMSGYYTVAAALNDHFRAHGPLSAHRLSSITAEECASIFGQDLGNAPIRELMGLFSQAWNDLGQYLGERYGGSFVALIEAAERSAEFLVQLLVQMPYFNDVATYGQLTVPFYKRAQLTAADLAIAFQGQGPGHFVDLDHLTIFADNLVPHVLRTDGILHYEDGLAERIDRQELIAAGSAEEVEIRACALHAVGLLSAQLRVSGRDVPPMKLDYLLWNRGQQPHYKSRPRHRTRTVYY